MSLSESWTQVATLAGTFVDMVRTGHGSSIQIGFFVSLLFLEVAASALLHRRWTAGDALPNLASGLISNFTGALIGSVVGLAYLTFYNQFRLVELPFNGLGFLLAFVAFEFAHYVQHWLGHRVGFFWALHSVHHSSTEMNVLVGPRAFWGIGFAQPVMLVLPFFGVSVLHLGVAKLVSTLFALFSHTNVVPKLGFLEHVLMTPANHRVHHGRQLKYLDANYGQTLLIFDKIFGTHQIELEKPDYGLVRQVSSRNPFIFQFAGLTSLFRQMATATHLHDRLLYLVMPPGWSHVGDHQTVAALRRAEKVSDNDKHRDTVSGPVSATDGSVDLVSSYSRDS